MKIKSVEGFTFTTAIRKLRKLTKRVKKVPGGTSAGKTFGILPILINRAAKQGGLEISVVSESIPHLKRGAIKDFKKIMRVTSRWRSDGWHGTDLRYTFANESYIEFFSADQEDKVRGPRRNILYINECNNISFETYHQLAIRTDIEIWLDYNPTHEFWIHTELQDDEDTETLILTYQDNEALSPVLVKEIEKARSKAFHDPNAKDLFNEKNIKSKYWSNWWKVYGLGLVGSLEGVIFNNWSQIHSIPTDAQLISYGLDFGFTNDPTSLIAVYKWNEKLILHELIYKTKMLNSDIIRECKTLCNKAIYITADSAEPKSIEEIKQAGIKIKAANKGADSIRQGIDTLQQYELLITSSSTNLIKEVRNYTWDTDKNGKKLNKPIDAYNHGLDSCRYASEMLHKPKIKWVNYD